MTARRTTAKPARNGSLRPLTAWPRLTMALAIGLAVGLGLGFSPLGLRPATCGILAWDAACVAFFASALSMMRGRKPADIRKSAASQDEGKVVTLALVIVAAAMSLVAVGVELSMAEQGNGWLKGGRIVVAFSSVAASWFMMHLAFALHYAHDYYAPDAGKSAQAGGLLFPGGEDPDYWDFLHFSVVIGVASQTADIAFTSKPLRRLGSVHSAVAFTFNTVVLALTINLLAGLF